MNNENSENSVFHFSFDGDVIDFLPMSKDNVMVNATQMAKIFNRKVEAFVRNDDTKRFINSCLKSENSRFLGIENESDLINSKQKSGTWMHRVLALKFAAWLNPDFELWVYCTVDKILFGDYKCLKQISQKKNVIKIQLDEKRKALMELPEFKDYVEVENKYNDAEKKRKQALKTLTKGFAGSLFD